MENLNEDSHFCHEPQLEDYLENCSDEYEVRKRLWSIFTLEHITNMRLPINISGVLEDTEEDVLDLSLIQKFKENRFQKLTGTKRR